MEHFRTYDEKLTELFDVAGKILETAYTEQETTQGATAQLNESRKQFESNLRGLMQAVKHEIEQSAGKTATQAADKLQAKFIEADQAAQSAKERYEKSARSLGWKMFAMLLIAEIVILGGGWLAFQRTVPSTNDIEFGYNELHKLENSVADLIKMNSKSKFELCPDQNDHKVVPCVRTNEQDGLNLWRGPNGETYRRIWKP